MNKILVFDMDGTIADLYGVPGWLDMIRNENPEPYITAKPLYDVDSLNGILEFLKFDGWKIVVTSWLAKNSTREYDKKVRTAKIEWLNKIGFPYDEIHIVKYGTTKANCTRKLKGIQILIDDNEKIRKGWTLGQTIDANKNILKELAGLV